MFCVMVKNQHDALIKFYYVMLLVLFPPQQNKFENTSSRFESKFESLWWSFKILHDNEHGNGMISS